MVSLQGKLSNGNNDLDPIGRFISDRSRMAPPTKEECDKLFEQMAEGSEEARKEEGGEGGAQEEVNFSPRMS